MDNNRPISLRTGKGEGPIQGLPTAFTGQGQGQGHLADMEFMEYTLKQKIRWKRNEHFEDTGAFKQAIGLLNRHGRVGIMGAPKSGKKILVKELLYHYEKLKSGKIYKFVTIEDEEECKNFLKIEKVLSKRYKFILVIFDLFEKPHCQKMYHENLFPKECKFIYTSLTMKFKEIEECLTEEELSRYKIFLHNFPLKRDHKCKILEKRPTTYRAKTHQIRDISQNSSNISFLFWLSSKDPREEYKEQIELIVKYMKKNSYLSVLVILLLAGGKLNKRQSKFVHSLQKQQLKLEIPKMDEILKRCEYLEGTYLQKDQEGTYNFLEPVIRKAALVASLSLLEINEIFNLCPLQNILESWNLVITDKLVDADFRIISAKIHTDLWENGKKSPLLNCRHIFGNEVLKTVFKHMTSDQSHFCASLLLDGATLYGNVDALQTIMEHLSREYIEELSIISLSEKIQITTVDRTEKWKSLLNYGLNFQETNERNQNIFHFLASADDDQLIRIFCDRPSDLLKSADFRGRTPLHVACETGKQSVIDCLLELDSEVINECDLDGVTPLHLSFKNNFCDENMIQCLLRAGANVNGCDNNHRISLHYTVYIETDPSDIIKLLISYCGDVNHQDRLGLTPFHLAVKRGNFEVAKSLIEYGANVNVCETDCNRTPLITVCGEPPTNVDAIVKLILEADCSQINYTDMYDQTALHEAVENGLDVCVDYLLRCGADPHITWSDGQKRAPLHMLFKVKNPRVAMKVFEKFWEHGADVDQKDGCGKTMSDLIKQKRTDKLFDMIETYKFTEKRNISYA